ncbi:hypothetical protein ACHAXH_008703 [Discostella pseudostelligera]
MDLRRIEDELVEISTLWEALRFKRPQFEEDVGGNDDESLLSLSARMSSWTELLSQVDMDTDTDEAENEDAGNNAENSSKNGKVEGINDGLANADDGEQGNAAATSTTSAAEENNAMDYEFGMCLLGGAGDTTLPPKVADNENDQGGGKMSVWERYAKKNLEQGTSKSTPEQKVAARVGEHEEIGVMVVEEDARPEEILSSLEVLHVRFLALGPKVEKLQKKSKERDLVTKKPRYGEKTMERVKVVLRSYAALEVGVSMSLDDTISGPGVISTIRKQIKQHNEKLELKMHALKSREQEEADRLALEAIHVEEMERQRILLAEQARREEEETLARLAHEARIRRMEEERAAEDAVRAADRELLALVPNIGPDGVRTQIGHMKMAIMNDNNVEGGALLSIALSSLRDMFTQIVRHPEEMKYRTVRRDHPKFIEDIGRHVGGREILIAAGFRLENVEGVPCLYSKEPDVEKDMDGWSDWFDNLKKTLEIIEDEIRNK